MVRKWQLMRNHVEPASEETAGVPEPTIGTVTHARGGDPNPPQEPETVLGAAPVEESMFVLRRGP